MIRLVTILTLVVFSCGWMSCRKSKDEGKKIDPRTTIWRKDNIPYGISYAYNQLKYIFPKAEIVTQANPPDNKSIFGKKNADEIRDKIEQHEGKTLQFVFAHSVQPSQTELEALMSYVYAGNHLFISTFNIGNLLSEKLGVSTYLSDSRYMDQDSLKVNIVNPVNFTEEFFSYPGRTSDNYISTFNQEYASVLGRSANGNPNFLKFRFETGGTIYLHVAPLTFSNFFLLHRDNKKYYGYALSNLPSDIELITWSDYFRNSGGGGNANSNNPSGSSLSRAFQWVKNQPSLAWAFALLLLLFVIVYLFDSKRKQRVVPVIPPLKNSSLDFVRTVGRLYYQRKDNKNLASKMTAHFQDHVRNKYNIPTSFMDEQFEKKLAYKTGIDQQQIHEIISYASLLESRDVVNDSELLTYNHQLQNFYKQA